MSSSSPVGNPFNLPLDPTLQFGWPGEQPADFTTVFSRHRDGCDGGARGPFEERPACRDGSSFPPVLDGHDRNGANGEGNPGGSQPWNPFGSWPGDSSGLSPGRGLNLDGLDSSSGGGCQSTCGGLSAGGPGGNTVYDGRYTIVATEADHGTLTVTDNVTHESFKVYGDPHIQTSAGGKGEFQHTPVTFYLPDGTKITVTPTNNTGPNSVNTIDRVTITKGNQAVTISGFGSQNGKLDVDYMAHAGYRLDAQTPDGVQLRAENGNIADLVGRGGLEIHNNPNNVVDIDDYAGGPHPPGCNGGGRPPIYPLFGDLNPTALGILRMILADNPRLGGWPGPNFGGWPASNRNSRDWWWFGGMF